MSLDELEIPLIPFTVPDIVEYYSKWWLSRLYRSL
jgi:hypothetical protein